jgi:hypothetical protein
MGNDEPNEEIYYNKEGAMDQPPYNSETNTLLIDPSHYLKMLGLPEPKRVSHEEFEQLWLDRKMKYKRLCETLISLAPDIYLAYEIENGRDGTGRVIFRIHDGIRVFSHLKDQIELNFEGKVIDIFISSKTSIECGDYCGEDTTIDFIIKHNDYIEEFSHPLTGALIQVGIDKMNEQLGKDSMECAGISKEWINNEK